MNFILNKARFIWHLVFWSAAFLILLEVFSTSGSYEKIDLIYTCIFIIPIQLAVYINLYILIPAILKRGKLLLFSLTLAGLTILTAGFIYLVFDRWIDLILKNYYFISYEEFKVLLIYAFAFLSISSLLKLSKERMIQLNREKQEGKIRLQNLQAQINPHFLLNSLQTIYALSISKSEKTADTILQLSDILKFTLYESEKGSLALERELEIISDYVKMYKLRTDPLRASIDLKISGDPTGKQIVPLLFIPFIENSFKHGLQGSEKNAYVKIDFQISEKKLKFTIENNAGSYDKAERIKYSGIGISNTKKRLELSYPGKHTLEILQNTDSFTVKLNLEF